MLRLIILAALGAGAYMAWKRYGQGRGGRQMAEPDEMYDSATIHSVADQSPATPP